MDKGKEVFNFLKTLEDSHKTMNIMVDRVDIDVLLSMHKYAKSMSKVKLNKDLDTESLISCAIIIGYLLKGHMDRVELNETITNNK